MSYSKKIYKKDSKGKIRVLHVYTKNADLISLSGLIDGKLSEDRSTSISKNIGKVNETTPTEQAIFEANAKIQSKMSEGYFETVKEAENNIVILPMLAKDYKKESHKVIFPCYAQPKLDGQRALGAKFIPMISRKGKKIDTMSHIQKDLDGLALNKGVYIDGELYAHGLSFQENMKLIKKYREGETEKVKFHVYDIVMDAPFKERYTTLSALVLPFDNVELVPTVVINNEDQLKEIHQIYLKQGYEGTIVRHSDATYGVNKRDSQLLKYKDFIDIACKVIDIVPSDKRPEQGVCVCELDTPKGKSTFHTGMKFSHTEREQILANKEKYVSQMAEIRFFEYTDDGMPRFPVCVGFRLDK
jgi:DNA ligase-1